MSQGQTTGNRKPIIIANRFAGSCMVCSTKVAVEAGFVWKSSKGWKTLCSSSACVQTATGWDPSTYEAPKRTAKLAVVDDNEVVTVAVSDYKLLPLLKAMPGARWNPSLNLWTASAAMRDRERLLEILDRGHFEVEPTLRKIRHDKTTVTAIGRGEAAGAYPFQLDGIRFLASHDRAILGDDMGLGKTFQTLMSVPKGGRVLAVVPNSIKRNWANEVNKWRPDLTPIVIKKKEDFRGPKSGEVVIVHYEAVRGLTIKPALAKALASTSLVVDEAHRCKNYKAKQTIAVTAMADLAKHTWGLTGTPLLNEPMDLYGVLSALGMIREVFGGYKGFMRDFNGYRGRYGHTFGTPDECVPEKMRRVMLRRLKKDVLDLPPKMYQTLVVDLEDAELTKELDTLYTEIGGDDALELPPFDRFSSLRKALAIQRIPAAQEFVADCEDQKVPLLVFSVHRKPVQVIGARPGWGAIYGSTPADKRQALVDAFQAGKLQGLALTIDVGGVGLNLTRASTVLFVDKDWTPGKNIQAEDRVHRIGQDANRVQIVSMETNHPLDQHVNALLAIKQRLLQKALEDTCEGSQQRKSLTFSAETQEELAKRLATIEEAAKREIAREKLTRKAQSLAQQGTLPQIKLTTKLRAEIRTCIGTLAACCDGAVTKDTVGFNKTDTYVGHWYACAGFETDDDYLIAYELLQKYVRQVGSQFPLVFPRTQTTKPKPRRSSGKR